MLAKLQKLRADISSVAIGRAHPEWRLVVLVAIFCTGAGASTSCWQTDKDLLLVVVGVLAGLVFALLAVWFRLLPLRSSMIYAALGLFFFGALLGLVRILSVDTTMSKTQGYINVIGVVERLDLRTGKPSRLYIMPTSVRGVEEDLPKLLRVSVRTSIEQEVRAGAVVTFSAQLRSLAGPLVPGGYDFARKAFFEGITADAIALSPIVLIDSNGAIDTHTSPIQRMREQIEAIILANITGQPGAVAVALTVGYRNHLSEETTDALRRAGLSHLLAISGLHMGLVTAASFLMFELILAAIPFVALRVMPRKIAVAPTWAVAITYLFLSGASTSTIRAFIMVSVGLLAVLTDRKVVSLRSVALAAFFIVCLWPESVLSAGFQMSFAATAGLVGFYERFSTNIAKWRERKAHGLIKVMWYVGGIALTSIVAQLSVAPYSLYHFQTLSIAGVVANILVLPVVSLSVMPLLLCSVLTAPVGGMPLFAPVLERALTYVLTISSEVSAFPGAVLHTQPISDAGLLLVTIGFIALLIIRNLKTSILIFSTMLIALLVGTRPSAEILISKSGKIVAVFHEGNIYSAGGRKGSFRDKIWHQYWGKPSDGGERSLPRICDASGCGYDIFFNGLFDLTYVETIAAVRQACGKKNIVILPRRYIRYCQGGGQIISIEELSARGPLALHHTFKKAMKLEWSVPQIK